ncbi:MAG: type II toxin-antitoxin system VapC family toxin [Actinomycetota bacterium]|nr:type II toxin-antitoxin system VapC family toxin [Actinomycetota bacterium]
MIYLDSSAIVKLMIAEPESPALHAVLVGEEAPACFTSQLAVTEVMRALHAKGETTLADGVAAATGNLPVPGQAILTRPAIENTFVAAGGLRPGSALRSLDAIHLATAQTAGDALTAVITYDARMADAARAIGLSVWSPDAMPQGGAPA